MEIDGTALNHLQSLLDLALSFGSILSGDLVPFLCFSVSLYVFFLIWHGQLSWRNKLLTPFSACRNIAGKSLVSSAITQSS